MHYFIDGYNLIFRLPFKKIPLQKKRDEVLSALNELIEDQGLDVCIVFDSAQRREGSIRGHFASLEVVYTDESQSADDYIYEALTFCRGNLIHETVVTSDRELAVRCKVLGARTQTIEGFLAALFKKKKKKKKSAQTQKVIADSSMNIERLLAIFEKRLLEDLED